MKPRIKICGICSPDDALAAMAAGADYAGVILAPGFRRTRTEQQACAIFAAVPAGRVGVFVNQDPIHIAAAAERLELAAVQLHGVESLVSVTALRALFRERRMWTEIWKAVPVLSGVDAGGALDLWSRAVDVLVLDTWSERGAGGTGTSFDWQAAATALRGRPRACRIAVAGGLTSGNVPAAIHALEPDVVDVSSGVEAEITRKSLPLMRAFMAAAAASARGVVS